MEKLLKQNHVKYGLIMSGVIVACLALMEITGQNMSFDKSPFQMIFMFLAPALVWYLGMVEKRKKQKNKITYKQALIEGVKISFVYGITSPFVFLAYYLFVNPAIVEFAKTVYNMPTASFSSVVAIDMLVQFVAAMIFGTLYATVIAILVRNKK